jgi:hypothetical protein
MKKLPYIIIMATLLGCNKEYTPEPESISESRGNKHVKAMRIKTQFGALVKGYAYDEGRISRIDYMDNGYNVEYNRKEGKITLQSYYFMPDNFIYTFGKDGRLKRMVWYFDERMVREEIYTYKGFMMQKIGYPESTRGLIVRETETDFLSPWFQRLVTSYFLTGNTTPYKRDTVYVRQTGSFELTKFDNRMQKQVVQKFSANIKDPEYNIPYTPSFARIDQCIAPENINRSWGMYDITKFLGRLMIKSTRYDNGPAYPDMWLENIVTDNDGMPVSYQEWFTERFRDGWSYSKAIPTTYEYTYLKNSGPNQP